MQKKHEKGVDKKFTISCMCIVNVSTTRMVVNNVTHEDGEEARTLRMRMSMRMVSEEEV